MVSFACWTADVTVGIFVVNASSLPASLTGRWQLALSEAEWVPPPLGTPASYWHQI